MEATGEGCPKNVSNFDECNFDEITRDNIKVSVCVYVVCVYIVYVYCLYLDTLRLVFPFAISIEMSVKFSPFPLPRCRSTNIPLQSRSTLCLSSWARET